MQQKEPDEKATSSQMQRETGEQKEKGSAQRSKDTGQDTPESKDKGSAQGKSQDQPDKSRAQREQKDKATKGTAERATEPKDKAPKGAAEKATEPRDKAAKGTSEKQSKDKAAGSEPKDKAAAEKGAEPKEKAAGTEPKEKSGSAARVQLSEPQRTNVQQTLLKEGRVNRVTNVNISINVGTRAPRSVRLAPLPASVIAIVPEYRTYRYFVVDERICIVDPDSYEIVEVIAVSGRTTARDDRGGSARLVLTEEEKAVILQEIDMRSGATLGLGAVTEGADVPRQVELRSFPAAVIEKVPKVRGYKFFSAENRVAIADSQGTKVQLVIEAKP
jgi:hypothetical protein